MQPAQRVSWYKVMPQARRKLQPVLGDFKAEIQRLKSLDSQTQQRVAALTRHQLHLLTEANFFRAYRAFENFIREIFLLYCSGKNTISGGIVTSYLKPVDFNHTEKLIKSGLRHLDWFNPDT